MYCNKNDCHVIFITVENRWPPHGTSNFHEKRNCILLVSPEFKNINSANEILNHLDQNVLFNTYIIS